MGKRILLADDSITIQKVIELTFSDEDFEVVTVGNGRLAVEKVQEVRPDVVLCDIIMPEKDGYDVCDFIKKSPQLSHIPVLLLTGAFEPFDQERAARVHCDGFLAKPFEPETLIAKVKELLAKVASRPAVSETAALRPPPLPPPASSSIFGGFTGAAPSGAAAPHPPAAAAFAPSPIAQNRPGGSEEEMFIPEEPFDDLDTGGFEAPPAVVSPLAPGSPVETPTVETAYPQFSANDPEDLVAMTAEEADSLKVPSEVPDDSSSTVMFRPGSLPWAPGQAAAPTATGGAIPGSPLTTEVPIFEEVVEEEEVEAAGPATAERPAAATASAPGAEAPPPAPPEPPPTFTRPQPPTHPAPPGSASFADVAAAIAPPPPPEPAASVAAQVDVPADMVSQIAQRVVAQVSEKVVERIAWEVIPDLAEALIKKEIERLRAELQRS